MNRVNGFAVDTIIYKSFNIEPAFGHLNDVQEVQSLSIGNPPITTVRVELIVDALGLAAAW
jgi:hypothetical protein